MLNPTLPEIMGVIHKYCQVKRPANLAESAAYALKPLLGGFNNTVFSFILEGVAYCIKFYVSSQKRGEELKPVARSPQV